MFIQGQTMFTNPEVSIVNSILLFGIVAAVLFARWVGKLNKEQHERNRAARARLQA